MLKFFLGFQLLQSYAPTPPTCLAPTSPPWNRHSWPPKLCHNLDAAGHTQLCSRRLAAGYPPAKLLGFKSSSKGRPLKIEIHVFKSIQSRIAKQKRIQIPNV